MNPYWFAALIPLVVIIDVSLFYCVTGYSEDKGINKDQV